MAIKLNHESARHILSRAVEIARAGQDLPVEWLSHARTVYGLESKTYFAAFGSLLLAKATDSAVDTLSIKVTESETSYSLRGIGHSVMVPGAVEHGFTLRANGREPLNNQPWFRYNRIDEFERVKVRKDYEYFLEVARRANDLSAAEALRALAAFVNVSLDLVAKLKLVSLKPGSVSPEGMRLAVEDFLRVDATDRPQRLQAFAASCLRLGHAMVASRRLNDPSRDLPGDVHAFSDDAPILAVEVRGKPVLATEVDAFIETCADKDIGRAVVFVDAPLHVPIDRESLDSHALRLGAVQLTLLESATDMLHIALAWADMPVALAAKRFGDLMLEELRAIEVKASTLEEWVRAVSIVQSR